MGSGRAPSALLQDLRDHTGADSTAAFADREAQTVLHRDRCEQLDRHLDVVTRHHHLGVARQPIDLIQTYLCNLCHVITFVLAFQCEHRH